MLQLTPTSTETPQRLTTLCPLSTPEDSREAVGGVRACQDMHTAVPSLQILAAALTECHRKSSAQGKPLTLKVFVAGRNRLENDGATALAEAFGVSHFFYSAVPATEGGRSRLLVLLG